ncbi:MAG: DUF1579 family protein [Pyrinomonadaceae bacterium]|nr:DUF1579 family protein [Pyrinomonadaceae bacterium]
MKKILVIILVLFLAALSASAQNEPSTGLLRAEMSKLDKMVGQWKGSGWIQQGAKRETFSGTETVQKKIDGLALLVEGKFSDAKGKVIHETLAVLSFDAKAKNYDFRTYLANGMSGEHEFKLLSDGYEWGFQFPAGSVRYLIKTNNDVWFETGEFSKDGKTWMKIFEMKLDKVK